MGGGGGGGGGGGDGWCLCQCGVSHVCRGGSAKCWAGLGGAGQQKC